MTWLHFFFVQSVFVFVGQTLATAPIDDVGCEFRMDPVRGNSSLLKGNVLRWAPTRAPAQDGLIPADEHLNAPYNNSHKHHRTRVCERRTLKRAEIGRVGTPLPGVRHGVIRTIY
jgi:hypothetical protein